MISLSKLYKSSNVISVEDLKRLEWYNRYVKPTAEQEEPSGPSVETHRFAIKSYRRRTFRQSTNSRNRRANRNACMPTQRPQIDNGGLERRLQDEETIGASIRREGYRVGFQEGKAQAEAEVRAQWKRC